MSLELPLDIIFNFLKAAGVEKFDNGVLDLVQNHLQDLFDFYLRKGKLCLQIPKRRRFSVYCLFIVWSNRPTEMIKAISRLSKGELFNFPPHLLHMFSWFFSIGMPQYASDALLCSHMNHKRHQGPRGRFKWFDKKIEAKSLIINHLSAPPEHKIKLLYELEKLKKMQQIEANIVFNEEEEQDITLEENYMKFLGKLNREMKIAEDGFRKKFLERKPNEYTSDIGNDLLIDVYERFDTFQVEDLLSYEGWTGGLLFVEKKKKWSDEKERKEITVPIVDKETFIGNWNLFTSKVFDGVDWSNLFVAGGAVLGPLRHDGLVGKKGFHNSDIDVFIYGLSPQEATKKIFETCAIISKNSKNEGYMLVSQHSVTLLGIYPLRHIQFVLRLYRNISEVLIGFDVDCCSVGFDGNKVYAIPRSRRAINTQCNITDMSRRSLTYETRLFKYAQRGFRVAVPGFRYTYVDSYRLPTRPADTCIGLTKLLVYDKYAKKRAYKPPNDKQLYGKAKKIINVYKENPTTDMPLKRAKYTYDTESDYAWVPAWGILTPTTIRELLESNVKQFTLKDGSIMHFCKLEEMPLHHINWIIDNPGRQLFTGSFHPIEDRLWEDRRSWDRRVAPKEPVSLMEIFTQRIVTRMAKRRQTAFNVLSSLQPFIGVDLINIILSFLDDNDLAKMNCLCKMNRTDIQRAVPIITKLTPVHPSSSIILDYSLFQFSGIQKDLFSKSIKTIIQDFAPNHNLSPDAYRLAHSVTVYLVERLTRAAMRAALSRQHHQRHENPVYISANTILAAIEFEIYENKSQLNAIIMHISTLPTMNNTNPFVFFCEDEDPLQESCLLFKNTKLIMKHICSTTPITTTAALILATIVEALVISILKGSQHSSENVIASKNVMRSIKNAQGMGGVLFPRYTVHTLDNLWGFCFGKSTKINKEANEMLNKIANNLVVNILNNVIPFMVERQIQVIRVEQVLKALMNVYTVKGHVIPLGFVKESGQEQTFVTHLEAEFQALINSLQDQLKIAQDIDNDEKYMDLTSLNLPNNYFHNSIKEYLDKHSYTITPKAEIYIQHAVERLMKYWGNPFICASKIRGSNEISAQDIELVLEIQGQLMYINKKPVTKPTPIVDPICTSEIEFEDPEIGEYSYYYNSTTFADRIKYSHITDISTCWTKFSLHLAEMIHETKRQKQYIIPRQILMRLYPREMQVMALTVLQELVESEMIEYLKNAVKLANYQEGNLKGIVTEKIFDSVKTIYSS